MNEIKSMYRGKKRFTRKQLVFMVEAAISAAMDRIEASLPSSGLAIEERKKFMGTKKVTEPSSWDNGALETCGMTIAILYAQLAGDGLGIGDALDYVPDGCKYSIRGEAERFIKENVKSNGMASSSSPAIPLAIPSSHKLAKAWVDEIFRYYLNPKPVDKDRLDEGSLMPLRK